MTAITAGPAREPGYPKFSITANDDQTVVTYQDRYKLQVDNENALGEEIVPLLSSDLQVGAPFGQSCFIKTLKLERHGDARLLYVLDVTADNQGSAPTNDIPPDQRRATWGWDLETVGMILSRDVDTGELIANKVGESYEYQYDCCIPILTIERWEIEFDPDTIINLVNHRNESTFWGAPAGSAICVGVRDREDTAQTLEGQPYRKVTYTFKFRVPDIDDDLGFPIVSGWKAILPNIGTFYYEDSTASPLVKRHFSASGAHVKGDLTQDGEKKGDAADRVYLNFNVYPKAEFNDYGLDRSQL